SCSFLFSFCYGPPPPPPSFPTRRSSDLGFRSTTRIQLRYDPADRRGNRSIPHPASICDCARLRSSCIPYFPRGSVALERQGMNAAIPQDPIGGAFDTPASDPSAAHAAPTTSPRLAPAPP